MGKAESASAACIPVSSVANGEADGGEKIGLDDTTDLRVVPTDEPSNDQEGADADRTGDEGDGLERRDERRDREECTEQAKEDRTVEHEDGQIGFGDRKTIEPAKLLGTEQAGEG